MLALLRAGRPAPGRAPPRAIDYSCGLILFKSDGGYSKRPRLFKTPAAQAARFTFAGGSTIGSCSAVRSTFLAVHRITQSVCVGLVKRVSYSLSDIPRNPNSRLLSVRFDCPGGVRASFQNCPSAFFSPQKVMFR